MVERGEADGLICGLVGRYHKKLGYLRSVFDLDPRVTSTSAMTGVINDSGLWFLLDTPVQLDPPAGPIAQSTLHQRKRDRYGNSVPVAFNITSPAAFKQK